MQMEMPEVKPKKYYWALVVPVVVLALGIVLIFMTEGLREKKEAQKEESLYGTILPEADKFEKVKTDKKAVKELFSQGGYADIEVKQILEGKTKNGHKAGTVYELCDKSGYGGDLTLLIGMNESDVICGIVIKEAPEIVKVLTEKEQKVFIEQFLYSRKDKAFWVDERMFGGVEIVKMESAPVTSREIVRMVNGCRQLSNRLDTVLAGGEGE